MARQVGGAVLLALGVILLAAASSVSGQASCQPPTSSVVRHWPAGPSVLHTIDPWIIPSVNTTNGSLPPGVCPFSAYPVINATCRDFIKFVGRAIPAGMRVHGVYLLEDDFVNQATGAYRCPSTATDVDLRNGTNGGYANPGRCRGKGMTQVLIDGTTNWTQPFVASEECSGYIELDELEVMSFKNAAGNCSTASVIATECLETDVYVANLSKLVKKGTSKTLAFSCPAIAGNQPGGAISHCHAKMTVVVNVKC